LRAPRHPAVFGIFILVTVGAAAVAGPAFAFDSKGHSVIEAVAYRTLVEGYGGEPARPDVLRDLINDGALDTPWCFGWGDSPPGECLKAPAENPLLCWPEPESDRSDAFFRRQFSDAGQCFHYMGTLTDSLTDAIPGTSIPRALATSAVVRCNDLLDGLLRQVVVDGGPGTRRSGFGLYEMMHAVEDSFSFAHTERTPEGERVDYLRVWKPIEKIAGIPTERSSKIPDGVFHKWDDHRDKTYVVEGGEEACEKRTDQPYDVPYACLSGEGERARQAIVELLVLVRDLRRAQLAAPAGTDTRPEASPEWRQYRAKWLTPVHACEGAECAVRQPTEPIPGKYAFLGFDTRFQTPGTFEAAARGTVLRYTEGLNPLLYSVNASLGYQYRKDSGSAGVVGLGVGLVLPLGLKSTLGLTPAELRIVFGGSSGGFELLTRLLRFDHALSDHLVLSVEAPIAVNWAEPAVHWSFTVGISYGLFSPRVVEGQTLLHHEERTERQDAEWVPPPAPYGRLQGRRTTVGVIAGISVTTPPADAVEGRTYGLGMLGAEFTWDRDRWGGRHAFTPVLSLSAGFRNTSGDSTYLTFTAGLGVRWYFLGPLGLSITAVRVEAGPKVRGTGETDDSTGVHGAPGSEYYLLAGSRIGLALRLGVLELLVDSPTIAWTSEPFGAHEILSFTLGIRL
jgi:hypothetical protein